MFLVFVVGLGLVLRTYSKKPKLQSDLVSTSQVNMVDVTRNDSSNSSPGTPPNDKEHLPNIGQVENSENTTDAESRKWETFLVFVFMCVGVVTSIYAVAEIVSEQSSLCSAVDLTKASKLFVVSAIKGTAGREQLCLKNSGSFDIYSNLIERKRETKVEYTVAVEKKSLTITEGVCVTDNAVNLLLPEDFEAKKIREARAFAGSLCFPAHNDTDMLSGPISVALENVETGLKDNSFVALTLFIYAFVSVQLLIVPVDICFPCFFCNECV
uniref:Uncharacterized protein n=1 Tax=Aplanochytrium stocchinoi TaxID=215587 RepID=A0A7S3V1T6_9STRA